MSAQTRFLQPQLWSHCREVSPSHMGEPTLGQYVSFPSILWPSASQWQPPIHCLYINLPFSKNIFYKQNFIIAGLLQLAFFYIVLRQYFRPFHGWTLFHYIDIPDFVCPLITWLEFSCLCFSCVNNFTVIIFSFHFIFVYAYVYVSACIYVLHYAWNLRRPKAFNGIPCNLSYRWLWAAWHGSDVGDRNSDAAAALATNHFSSPSFLFLRKTLGVLHRLASTSWSSCFSFQSSRTRRVSHCSDWLWTLCVRFHGCLSSFLHWQSSLCILGGSLVRFMTCKCFYYLMDLLIFFLFVYLCVWCMCVFVYVSLYMWGHRYVYKCTYVCVCVEAPGWCWCFSPLFSTFYIESGLLTEPGACHLC